MEPAHVLGPLTTDHVQSALETHVTLYGVFHRNYAALSEFELAVESNVDGESADWTADDALGGSFVEYLRHLQNFVDAQTLLAEYTSTLESEWFDDEQAERYRELAADLDVVAMAAFLSELPACLIAVGRDSFVRSATADDDGHSGVNDAGCLLSCDRLMNWNGWSDDARRVLAGFDEAVLLSSAVESYIAAQSTLHAQLFELLEEQLAETDIDERFLSSADVWAVTD